MFSGLQVRFYFTENKTLNISTLQMPLTLYIHSTQWVWADMTTETTIVLLEENYHNIYSKNFKNP